MHLSTYGQYSPILGSEVTPPGHKFHNFGRKPVTHYDNASSFFPAGYPETHKICNEIESIFNVLINFFPIWASVRVPWVSDIW